MGNIIWKQEILVDPIKIVLVMILPPHTNLKMLHATLGHNRYYRKFIHGYAVITAPMEKLLKKDSAFICIQE